MECQPVFYHRRYVPQVNHRHHHWHRKGSGAFFTWADGKGELFSFFGFEGKPAAYMVVFSLCAVAYLIGWFIMKSLVPKYKPISLD